MIIIALDGAKGTGKSTLINRLGDHFKTHMPQQVSTQQLISSNLDQDLDQFIRNGVSESEQKKQYCGELIREYTEGIRNLQRLDRVQRRHGYEQIFILDRYLLSLYAIQGECWQMPDLFEICRNLPKPDRQFIIQLQDRYNEEDKSFITARDKWISHGFETGNCKVITNIISGIDVAPQDYNPMGYNNIVECITSYLQGAL